MADPALRDQPGPLSFSEGVDKFVQCIRPHGRPETAFPPGLDMSEARRGNAEDLHGWFVRVVNTYCGGDPSLVGIEENIAVLAKLRWDRGRLAYACVPALVAATTLEEYYLDGGAATYIRLDLDYGTLGEPFSHPLVHIHIGDGDSPRFALDGGTSGNVVMDFLEFVYRNHVPAKWLQWARRQWLSERADEDRIALFSRIVEAFRDAQFSVLRANQGVLLQVKRTLRKAKDALFADQMDGADRQVLEYPLAR